MSNLHGGEKKMKKEDIAYRESLSVVGVFSSRSGRGGLPPLQICRYSIRGACAVSLPRRSERERERETKTEVINFRGNTFSSSLSSSVVAAGPACTRVRARARAFFSSLPTCPSVRPSVVCLSMQGISDFNLPSSLTPSVPSLPSLWVRPRPMDDPFWTACRQSLSLSLFPRRDTRFIESTGGGSGGGMRRDEKRRNILPACLGLPGSVSLCAFRRRERGCLLFCLSILQFVVPSLSVSFLLLHPYSCHSFIV